MALEPVKQRPGIVFRMRMGSCMRRCAQPAPVETLRWRGIEIDRAGGERPFLMVKAGLVQRGGKRWIPFRILVEYKDHCSTLIVAARRVGAGDRVAA
jgi:hypothetical protein